MTAKDKDTDRLRRFVFEHAQVRGQLVSLDATWQAVLERGEYPEPVRDLLGEAMAAASLLAGTVRLDGSLTLQFHSSGPVSLMVVECTGRRTLRGLAHWDGPIDDAEALLGEGRVAITIDPGTGGERYQGIVDLMGRRPAEAVEAYFRQSEQIDTRLWLAADAEQAGGLLLQALPGSTAQSDTWTRVVKLADTVTAEELLKLSAETLLHRLYHEDDIRLFEGDPVSFHCTCSRARIEQVLQQFGREEARQMLAEHDPIEVVCEFCNRRYEFDAIDVEHLFAADHDRPPGSGTSH